MRIGIDIDDTITYTWKTLIPIYSQKFSIPIDKLEKSLPYYNSITEYASIDEYFKLMRNLEPQMKEIPLRENVRKILTKLKEEGHTIIFITARGKDLKEPYKTTKEYLERNSIPYDKIIVRALDKGKVSVEEQLDIFIDDSIKHCEMVSSKGIDVLMMTTEYNKEYHKFTHVDNWNQIYEYINNR